MKKPFRRWLVSHATTITPMTAPPAKGVNSPTTSRTLATSSVTLAVHAWRRPGRIPRLSNHRPVPAIFPPPKTWFHP